MSVLKIPVPTDTPFWALRVQLDGSEYVLEGEWNSRHGWYLGVKQSDGETWVQPPVRLNPRRNILQFCAKAQRPPGAITLIARDGSTADCTYSGLGTTHELFYVEESDLLLAKFDV